jgi:hypothetical protein
MTTTTQRMAQRRAMIKTAPAALAWSLLRMRRAAANRWPAPPSMHWPYTTAACTRGRRCAGCVCVSHVHGRLPSADGCVDLETPASRSHATLQVGSSEDADSDDNGDDGEGQWAQPASQQAADRARRHEERDRRLTEPQSKRRAGMWCWPVPASRTDLDVCPLPHGHHGMHAHRSRQTRLPWCASQA